AGVRGRHRQLRRLRRHGPVNEKCEAANMNRAMQKIQRNDHPEPELLHRFALGDLSAAEADAVVMHLMRGCARCRAQVEPHLRTALAPAEPPASGEPTLDRYDRAVEAALSSVLLHGAAAVEVRKRTREILAKLRAGGDLAALPLPPATAAPPAERAPAAPRRG